MRNRQRSHLSAALSVLANIGLAVAAVTSAQAADDPRVVAQKEGKGRTVVVIPGLLSSPDVFKPSLGAIDGVEWHWMTVAGFGGVPAPASIDPFVVPAGEAVADYLAAEDLADVVVIGHSMGGVLALIAAEQVPERIDHIVIVDSAPFLAGLLNPFARPEQAAASRNALRRQFMAMDDTTYLSFVERGLAVQSKTAEGQAKVMDDVRRSDLAAARIAGVELYTTDYRDLLPKIAADVTVLAAWSPETPMPRAELERRYKEQYKMLESVEIIVIDDSRHFIQLDQPTASRDAVETVLGE